MVAKTAALRTGVVESSMELSKLVDLAAKVKR
jgi:hypothetical protein